MTTEKKERLYRRRSMDAAAKDQGSNRVKVMLLADSDQHCKVADQSLL